MGYIGIYLRLLVFGFSPPLVYSVHSSFFAVISTGGVEVLASSLSGGYFVLLGAPFDSVYLEEEGGWRSAVAVVL